MLGTIIFIFSFFVYFNKSNSVIKNALISFVSLSFIGLFAYGISFTNKTNTLISSLNTIDYEEQSYSIVTNKDSDIGLKLGNNNIGYLKDDANNEEVLKELKSRTTAKAKSSDNITTAAVELTEKVSDSLVLRDTSLQLLNENYKSFYDNLKVLDTFNVKVKKKEVNKVADITKPFIVYISGIDTYGDINKVSRSDVNILAVVNPETYKILLINTPRDYYVQLHGTTGSKDKLTHAGIYGIDMSESTLEDLYATKVDYNVRINFQSLMKTVDAVGGVTVQSDQAFTSGKYKFQAGANQLDGQSALAFSRTRYAFADGDRSRGKNQQKVIEAIVDKLTNPNVIVKNQSLIDSLEGTVQTNASEEIISKIIKQQMDTIGRWKVESISVTGKDSRATTYSMGNIPLYVMEPDLNSLTNAKNKIQEYTNPTTITQ